MVMPCSRSARRPSVSSARFDVVAAGAGALDGLVLVLEHGLAVVQQPADEGALAVVHRAGGGDAQDVLAGGGDLRGLGRGGRLQVDGVLDGAVHQKYPSFFRSSMAASLTLSSPRVAPRSVMRVTAISAMTSSTVVACERTAAVRFASPTVR